MLSPRIRRLKLDHASLFQRFKDWPLIKIVGTAGMPPEVYRFTYSIKGVYVAASGEILERDMHVLEVNLSLGYPRRAPQCRMLTPVFHPNFDDATVCIGDFWAASEGLDTLLLDALGTGGQAASSSRIENYPGFPSGLSGHDLTQRAALQAFDRFADACAVRGRLVRADAAGGAGLVVREPGRRFAG